MSSQHGVQVRGSDFWAVAYRKASVGFCDQELGKFDVLCKPGVFMVQTHSQGLIPGKQLFFTHDILGQDA